MRAFLAKFRFIMAYAKEYGKASDHGAAIHSGLTALSRKPPFDVLTPDDIKRVVPVWSLIPDPKVISGLVANIVREKNAFALKDKWFLDQLAKKYRAINKGKTARRA